jgi:hypothetical protein
MGKGVQETAEGRKGDKRPRGAAGQAARPRRQGRSPKESEPGINHADLLKAIGYYFPKFNGFLASLEDFRRKDRIYYPLHLLLVLAIVERICGNRSARQHDRDKREGHFADNILRLCGCQGLVGLLPHSDTIKYFLEKCAVSVLCGIPARMVSHLIRTKRLGGMYSAMAPVRGRPSLRVTVDGVHYATSLRPLPHSTHRTRRDGVTEYMLVALQATLVSPSGLRLPLMTEFIENPDGEYDKQDCELKAAKRLLLRLKQEFPHLRVTVLMDGLYLCEEIIKICKESGWNYSLTVTDRAPAFKAKAEEALAKSGRRARGKDPVTGFSRQVEWCNGVMHAFGKTTVRLNVIRMKSVNSKGDDVTLFYATNIFLHAKEDMALRVLDEVCRARWQIEESFDEQKHHGLWLEAAFGTRDNAGQNFYIIVQIASIIRTLMLHSNLFRRLQRHCNPGLAEDVFRKPALDWYVTVANFVERLKQSMICCRLSGLDISGWRLECDTA